MPSAFLSCCPCQKRDLSGRLSRIHFCDLMYVNGMVFIPHVIIAVFQRSSIRPSAKHLQRLCVHTFPPCARYESMPEAVQGFTAKKHRLRPAFSCVPTLCAVWIACKARVGRFYGKQKGFLVSQLPLREFKCSP